MCGGVREAKELSETLSSSTANFLERWEPTTTTALEGKKVRARSERKRAPPRALLALS